jgi:hypothetical protein
MLLSYDRVNVAAHLAVGLLEEVNITPEMRCELSIINDLIESLQRDFADFCVNVGVKNSRELLEKIKDDKELDQKARDWMTNIFNKKNLNIIKLVQAFNIKHNKSYADHMAKKQVN